MSYYIFSFGSNILSSRINERVGKSKFIEFRKLKGFELVFNKKSKDGSSKANLKPNRSGIVYGTIREFTEEQKLKLNKFEGLGYGYEFIHVATIDSKKIYAYIATDPKYLTEDLLPFDWYLNYVIEGLKENNVEEDYLNNLKNLKYLKS